MLVCINHVAELLLVEMVIHLMLLPITLDVLKSSVQSDVVIESLPLLDDHDLLHGIYHVELHDVLTEFA